MTGKRQKEIAKSVRLFIPQAPFYDAEAIRAQAAAPHLRGLSAETASWLSIIAYIRHIYTDYDILRDEGYEREAARFFVLDAINEKLRIWRATRFLTAAETEAETEADAEAEAKGAYSRTLCRR